jgi:hypothetical protein
MKNTRTVGTHRAVVMGGRKMPRSAHPVSCCSRLASFAFSLLIFRASAPRSWSALRMRGTILVAIASALKIRIARPLCRLQPPHLPPRRCISWPPPRHKAFFSRAHLPAPFLSPLKSPKGKQPRLRECAGAFYGHGQILITFQNSL